MPRIIKWASLLLLLCGSAFAQFGSQTVILFPGVPSGSCSQSKLGLNSATADLYSCGPSATWVKIGPSSTANNPGGSANQIQFNSGGVSFGGFTMSQDCTIVVATGIITCTKTNNVPFAPSATTDTTNAGNISSGNLPNARLVSVPNSVLQNSSVFIGTASTGGLAGGGSVSLGGTLNITLLQTCTTNQVLQWNGSQWVCASAGTGTVTGATTNGGLLLSSTTLGLLTSCSTNQVLQWNGSAWVCATISGTLPSATLGYGTYYDTSTTLHSGGDPSPLYACPFSGADLGLQINNATQVTTNGVTGGPIDARCAISSSVSIAHSMFPQFSTGVTGYNIQLPSGKMTVSVPQKIETSSSFVHGQGRNGTSGSSGGSILAAATGSSSAFPLGIGSGGTVTCTAVSGGACTGYTFTAGSGYYYNPVLVWAGGGCSAFPAQAVEVTDGVITGVVNAFTGTGASAPNGVGCATPPTATVYSDSAWAANPNSTDDFTHGALPVSSPFVMEVGANPGSYTENTQVYDLPIDCGTYASYGTPGSADYLTGLFILGTEESSHFSGQKITNCGIAALDIGGLQNQVQNLGFIDDFESIWPQGAQCPSPETSYPGTPWTGPGSVGALTISTISSTSNGIATVTLSGNVSKIVQGQSIVVTGVPNGTHGAVYSSNSNSSGVPLISVNVNPTTAGTVTESGNTVTVPTASGNYPNTFQLGQNVVMTVCSVSGYNITAQILTGGAGTTSLTFTDPTGSLGSATGCTASAQQPIYSEYEVVSHTCTNCNTFQYLINGPGSSDAPNGSYSAGVITPWPVQVRFAGAMNSMVSGMRHATIAGCTPAQGSQIPVGMELTGLQGLYDAIHVEKSPVGIDVGGINMSQGQTIIGAQNYNLTNSSIVISNDNPTTDLVVINSGSGPVATLIPSYQLTDFKSSNFLASGSNGSTQSLVTLYVKDDSGTAGGVLAVANPTLTGLNSVSNGVFFWEGTQSFFNNSTSASATISLAGLGTFANLADTALTTGFIPKAGIPMANTLCDEGITTASTLTCGDAGGITASAGPVTAASDGTHAGSIQLVGNTTVPTFNSNSVGWLGPNSASFTKYFFQPSSTAPVATGPMIVGAVASNVSAVTYGTRSGNTSTYATTSGTLTSGDGVKIDANGNLVDGGGAGTVTSIATTGPITGGTITTTGTIACATCVTSAASLTSGALMTGAGSQASQTVTTGTGVVTALGVNTGTAGAFVVNGGALGTPSSGTLTNATGYLENNLTGAGAAGTITEGGSTFSVTRAGISTAALTAPWVFTNANSTNNNTSFVAGFSASGTSTGQTVMNLNQATTGGDILDWGTGGSYTAGAISGQTISGSILENGSIQEKGTTAGFFAVSQGSTSSAIAPCNAANTICFQAPTAVTAQLRVFAGAPATGFSLFTNSSGTMTETISATSGTLNSGVGLLGTLAVNTVLSSTVANAAGHFTNIQVVTALGGTCTTLPQFNVFDGATNVGSTVTANAATQTKGTGNSTAQTLTFASGDVIGIFISTAGGTCVANDFIVSAQYSIP